LKARGFDECTGVGTYVQSIGGIRGRGERDVQKGNRYRYREGVQDRLVEETRRRWFDDGVKILKVEY